MGTTLTGTTPQDTYDSLIKVTDNGPLSGSLKTLTDGLGNNSALALSTGAASITGTLAVSSSVATGGIVSSPTYFFRSINAATEAGTETSIVSTGNGENVRAGVFATNNYAADLSTSLLFKTNASSGGGTERMRITSAGDVGIGTSAPTATLDARIAGTTSGAVIKVGNVGTGDFGGLAVSDGGTYPVQLYGSSLAFLTGNSAYASATEKVRITSAGAVGIGTTATSTAGNPKLQVNGSVSKETQAGAIANAATITLFTLTNNGVFLVTTMQNDDVAARSTTCLIFTESSGTTTRQVDLATGSLWTVSMSGLSVQLTNTSLQTRGYSASILQLF